MAKFRFSSRRRFRFRAPVVLLALAVLLFFWSNLALRPRLLSVAAAALRNRVTALVQNAVMVVFQKEGYRYDDFIRTTQKADGSVSTMAVDTARLNLALCGITEEILRTIGEDRRLSLPIPLGTLSGSEWFSGRGPDVNFTVVVEKGLHAGFRSEFSTQGINQTLHTIVFTLQMQGSLLMAGGSETIDLSEDVLAAQNVILGDVPETYTNINRLTSDITEEEIDDIFDFGHT